MILSFKEARSVHSCLINPKFYKWMISASSYHKLTIYSNYIHDDIAYFLKLSIVMILQCRICGAVTLLIRLIQHFYNAPVVDSTIQWCQINIIWILYNLQRATKCMTVGTVANPYSGDSSQPTHAGCFRTVAYRYGIPYLHFLCVC